MAKLGVTPRENPGYNLISKHAPERLHLADLLD